MAEFDGILPFFSNVSIVYRGGGWVGLAAGWGGEGGLGGGKNFSFRVPNVQP